MSNLSLQSKVTLRDGNEIPILGFGTYELDGDDAYRAVKWALEAGYRNIDSAAWYINEAECGRAIRDFCKVTGTPRSEIFFITKLRDNIGHAATKKAIQASLQACNLDYIDLYLLHSPIGGPQARKDCWTAVCEAQQTGKLKSIGVSNFGVQHLMEMVDGNVPMPVVNQVDLHPFMTRKDIVSLCIQHGVTLQAWAPLVRGYPEHNHPSIASLARKYAKEPAHVLLRYSIQKGYIPLPKSANKARIISNTKIFDFELSPEEILHLDSLDSSLTTDWDPTNCP